ncbi:hypothetical protein FHS29_006496 [Saccharothrix tamanrassetensis]|uniref:Uncharacterized protein n=1 Tax=Saccharothrix tamanrassetensis TaxID=1051531 RepID=A0A841CU83_9PSEU|nr:hypothetical protein [Saccharothrix tamanrassetensis]MBB5959874.1 hypothetical protein [Saccharothrix tamanrassetensis]
MRNTEADTLDELIDDCTAMPAELRPTAGELPEMRAASPSPWQVTDACVAQVDDLDAYV